MISIMNFVRDHAVAFKIVCGILDQQAETDAPELNTHHLNELLEQTYNKNFINDQPNQSLSLSEVIDKNQLNFEQFNFTDLNQLPEVSEQAIPIKRSITKQL